MELSKQARYGVRFLSAVVGGCLMSFTGLGPTDHAAATAYLGSRAAPAGTQAIAMGKNSCLLEIYAYLRVAIIAEEFGRNRDLLAGALDDLREKLVDCLSPPDASSDPGGLNSF